MKLTPKTLHKINSSKWIQEELIGYELGLHKCNKAYQVFEIVMLNVASEMCKSWKDIYNANPRNSDNFSQLCIAAILIDKWLRIRFEINEVGRIKLLGSRLSAIVQEYKYSMKDND
jgi:hypothetical protein